MTKIYSRRVTKKFRKQLRNDPTYQESKLWGELQGKKLGYKFRRQQSVGKFIVDFYCPEVKLAIEVDGRSHDGRGAFYYDQKRQKIIEKFGITFLRYSNQEIIERKLEGVVLEIKEVCDRLSGEERAWKD